MLDLTMFEEKNVLFCVRCRDEESTLTFLNEMIRQYPEKTKFWHGGENKWEEAIDDDRGHVDYFPYINNCGGTTLAWDSDSYAEDHRYRVVEFYDIPGATPIEDLGEIDCCNFNIGDLF
jgi:hypothetical protein